MPARCCASRSTDTGTKRFHESYTRILILNSKRRADETAAADETLSVLRTTSEEPMRLAKVTTLTKVFVWIARLCQWRWPHNRGILPNRLLRWLLERPRRARHWLPILNTSNGLEGSKIRRRIQITELNKNLCKGKSHSFSCIKDTVKHTRILVPYYNFQLPLLESFSLLAVKLWGNNAAQMIPNFRCRVLWERGPLALKRSIFVISSS